MFISFMFIYLFVWDKLSPCSPEWPGTCYIAQADLELTILLPQHPSCWDNRYEPPRLAPMFLYFLSIKFIPLFCHLCRLIGDSTMVLPAAHSLPSLLRGSANWTLSFLGFYSEGHVAPPAQFQLIRSGWALAQDSHCCHINLQNSNIIWATLFDKLDDL
jgi:hypothetical protein